MKQNYLAYLFFPTGYVFFLSIFDNHLILTRKRDEINLLLLFSNPDSRRGTDTKHGGVGVKTGLGSS